MDRVKNAYEMISTRQMNCAQSVLTAFCEELGLEKDIALRLARGFGGGMGRTGNVCGAVTGAYMVLGLQQYPEIEDRSDQIEKVYQLVKDFSRMFIDKNKSIRCTDLLGCDLSAPGGLDDARSRELFTTVCPRLVADSVAILETMLKQQ
jgi:C_GCAxxG_C_C family probable redox protein